MLDTTQTLDRPPRLVRTAPSTSFAPALLVLGLPALALVAGLVVPHLLTGGYPLLTGVPGSGALWAAGLLGGLAIAATTPVVAVALAATAIEDFRRSRRVDPRVVAGLVATVVAAVLMASPVGLPLVLFVLD